MIVCSFSGAIGDMKKGDRRDPVAVLAVLSKSPTFSVFDATEDARIARSLTWLLDHGYIEYPKPQPGFPWSRVSLTDKAHKLIARAPA